MNTPLTKLLNYTNDSLPATWLLVSTANGTISLMHEKNAAQTWPASIGKNGTGCEEGSGKTPQGIHRVVERYGHDLPAGQILVDRIDTGLNAHAGDTADTLVLSRILRLAGCEQGANKGPGVDTYRRFVYIHGAAREELVGKPQSQGCVTMKNSDVIALFDFVKEGTLVVID